MGRNDVRVMLDRRDLQAEMTIGRFRQICSAASMSCRCACRR
jgi:hypothetical protein